MSSDCIKHDSANHNQGWELCVSEYTLTFSYLGCCLLVTLSNDTFSSRWCHLLCSVLISVWHNGITTTSLKPCDSSSTCFPSTLAIPCLFPLTGSSHCPNWRAVKLTLILIMQCFNMTVTVVSYTGSQIWLDGLQGRGELRPIYLNDVSFR